jgi:hypothetical protein
LPARWGFLLTRPFRQLRQLGDFGGDAPSLVAGVQLGRLRSARI